ncbi:MAG: hypothetical protein WCK59_03145 [Candidatus Falkowbacteria bacterium]
MYNKIASIILNSGKNLNYAGQVFVSQPDAEKERLAGKIFVLAEIEGKKNETQKIINFLVNIFDYNYYGDEKILLRDKVDGLKIENIFELVLARVNQGLVDFLQEEHLKINPSSTNLTLGVVYENKLYFSSYGKNKAFLIFRRQGDYDMINIESNVTEEDTVQLVENHEPSSSKIFSAVINGEIPAHSYFLFTNEALPEYLSNRELIGVITKLPPMVAAEQIKNLLQKINSFAPFLGIIVKSTLGTGLNEIHENLEENEAHQVAGVSQSPRGASRNAHSSISHLNYTEQKTERMLAPAGIISLKKIAKWTLELASKFKVEIPENRKVVKFYEETDETIITQAPARETKRVDLVSQKSFIIKDKLIFKKKSYNVFPKIFSVLQAFSVIFLPRFWVGIYQGLRSWLKTLGKKDKVLVGALLVCFLVLIVSLIFTSFNKKTRLAVEQFNQIATDINNKQAQIDSYLLYNNESAAEAVLMEATNALQNSLPLTKEQIAQKAELLIKLTDESDKIQKITKVSNFQEIVSASAWNAQAGADNLVLLNDKLYLSDGVHKSIYNFNLKDSSRSQLTLNDSVTLSSPAISDSIIYYLAGQKIVKINGETVATLTIGPEKLQGDNMTQIYNGALYLLSKSDNQIYRYSGSSSFSNRSNWLKAPADLSLASDFKIDGKVTVSQSAGDLLKFNKGQKVDYKTAALSPEIRADKILMTTNNIYLLDLNNKRLISLTKNGVLIKQYRLVKDDLKDFAIDETTKSVYILAANTVYKFGL